MIRMLIADDEKQACQDMLACIRWADSGITVVSVCDNGDEAIEALRAHRPDVALLDIEMPGLDGLEVIEQAHAENIDCAFIIISGYDSFHYMQKAIRLRVDGYLLKPYTREDLLREIAQATERMESVRGLNGDDETRPRHFGDFFRRMYSESNLRKLRYPSEEEERLVEALDAGDEPAASAALDDFFRTMRACNDTLFTAVLCCMTLRIELAHMLIDRDLAVEVGLFQPILWSETPNLEQVEQSVRQSVDSVFHILKACDTIPPSVSLAVRYIQQAYANKKLMLETVAEHVNITPCYLSSLFNASMKMSFTDYIHSVRVRHAQQLMRSTNLRNYEISERVGYADPKYFAQMFKKMTRLTPSEYKQTVHHEQREG